MTFNISTEPVDINLDINTATLDTDTPAKHTVCASTPAISDDERLESLAQEIARLHIKASLQIAERLAKAPQIFRYRRDEGGFTGWVENRLKLSSSTAYRLLDVHERFGGDESLSIWETLPISAVYLLAARSTPDKAVQEIAERVKVGEQISYAEAKKTIGRARRQENGAKSDKAGGDVVDDAAASGERRKAQYAAMETAPLGSDAKGDPENTASGTTSGGADHQSPMRGRIVAIGRAALRRSELGDRHRCRSAGRPGPLRRRHWPTRSKVSATVDARPSSCSTAIERHGFIVSRTAALSTGCDTTPPLCELRSSGRGMETCWMSWSGWTRKPRSTRSS